MAKATKVKATMTRPEDRHEWLSFEDPEEERTWVFDLTFLLSKWTCIYGSGCKGVLTEDSEELVQGCCSYGAHFTDDADRARVEVAAQTLTPEQWQFHAQAQKKGIVKQQKDGAWITRQADDACIFLNRPGFPGGPGCALHRAAIDQGRHFMEMKPDVCWQLPLRRVDSTDDLGHVWSTVREWKRRDWGDGGKEFSWWCTESPDAFVGDHTVLVSGRDEIIGLCGEEIYDVLLDAVAERLGNGPVLPHPAVRVQINGRRGKVSA